MGHAEDDAELAKEEDEEGSLSSVGDLSGSVRFSTNEQKGLEDGPVPSEEISDYMDLADELPDLGDLRQDLEDQPLQLKYLSNDR